MGSITYNVDENRIYISDFGEGNYITLEDIYQANVANNWGIIEKIGDFIYRFHCRVRFNKTNFWERNKVWVFADGIVDSSNKTLVECYYEEWASYYFRLGEVTNEEQRTSKNGCVIINEESTENSVTLFWWYIWKTYTKIDILSTTFKSPNSTNPIIRTDTNDYGEVRIWNVFAECEGFSFWCKPKFAGLWGRCSLNTDENAERVFLSDLGGGVWNPTYLRNVTLRNCGQVCHLANVNHAQLIDVDPNTWKVGFWDWDGPGLYGDVTEIYTFNLKIQDKDGNPLGGVNVELYDKDSDLIFQTGTDADGTILEQLVSVRFYQPPDGWTGAYASDQPKIDYNPFTLKIEKNGYSTVEEKIRIDDKINWLVSLGAETYKIDDIMNKLQAHRNTVEPNIDTTISSRASQSSVDAIPTNPVLDNDPRLDNLDESVSSRASTEDLDKHDKKQTSLKFV